MQILVISVLIIIVGASGLDSSSWVDQDKTWHLRSTRDAIGSGRVEQRYFTPDGYNDQLPIFVGHVENKTERAGNSVILVCKVKNLGFYKVAWVRVDTQTILTIHHHIITRNQRVSLSHHDNEVWRLHLDNVEESDRGWYMCQINTEPMRSQKGYLSVVVPPTIVDERTSSDVVVKEGSLVNLTCQATGSPAPQLRWRRADGEKIRYVGGHVVSVEGNSLVIPNAGRVHIGTYYCIASNGVPPTKSKSIVLRVQFAPMIWVENQLEFAAVGHNISLRCSTESYPAGLHFWTFQNGSAVSAGRRFITNQRTDHMTTHMSLTILNVGKSDFGTYFCVAKNSLGKQDGAIKLSERYLPSTAGTHLTSTQPPIRTHSSLDLEQSLNYDPFLPNQEHKKRRQERKQENKRQQRKEKTIQDFEPFRRSPGAWPRAHGCLLSLALVVPLALTH